MTASTENCITFEGSLPNRRLEGVWESIVGVEKIKEQLANQALLSLGLRAQLPFSACALHGLILLHGDPGTGKTTLARGLGQEIAPLVKGGSVRLIEVNPHGLMSADHGQSQQRVTELLCEDIPLRADDGRPTIVLVDEVESMVVARSAASLEANPADVHRATDAVLMALDRNAHEHPHLLMVATSNFTESLDEAFRSRADLTIEVPRPNAAGILKILSETLADFGKVYPKLNDLAASPRLRAVATALDGFDGRRVRKVITEALAAQRKTVLDPNALEADDLLAAAKRLAAREEIKENYLEAA